MRTARAQPIVETTIQSGWWVIRVTGTPSPGRNRQGREGEPIVSGLSGDFRRSGACALRRIVWRVTSMDAKQFDSVAKVVGQGTARRQLLAGLFGASLAGSLGRATVTAKGKQRHRVTAQDDTPKLN